MLPVDFTVIPQTGTGGLGISTAVTKVISIPGIDLTNFASSYGITKSVIYK